MARCQSTYPGAATLRGRPIRCESAAGHDGPHGHSFAARYWADATEVCGDCGRMAEAACPWRATTCSACSAARDRYPRADITLCPAHGAYLPDGEA